MEEEHIIYIKSLSGSQLHFIVPEPVCVIMIDGLSESDEFTGKTMYCRCLLDGR